VERIPTNIQTLNLLIDKLCKIELGVDKMAIAEVTAYVAHENDKKRSNFTKVNSSKSKKRGAECEKQIFPCNKCKQHILNNISMHGTELLNRLQRSMMVRSQCM
jgi:hypothetical protein